MERYKITECLHKAGGREVLLVKEKATGKCLVIKRIKVNQMKDDEEEETIKEVQALLMLRHRHIVSIISSFKEEATKTINIVMPYCPGGDLYEWIDKQREARKSFPTADIVMILLQLCEALAYIHSKHTIHRDIKPRNIFLENKWTVKLGDFGIAKILDSDMWSLGCVLYEMNTLEQPFQAKVWHELIYQITNDPYPQLPVHVDRNLADLVAELLHKDPSKRPDAEQVLKRQLEAKISLLVSSPAAVNTDLSAAKLNSDRSCPVCNNDYSQMSMEEFQTHVFECLDDENPPETMKANTPPERLCPMCSASFSYETPQAEYERHVHGHFGEENPEQPLEILRSERHNAEQILERQSVEFRSTPICRMAQTTDRIPLNILLIGKTGHGKSATGNSILGQRAFKSSSGGTSETKLVTDAWAEHGPYEIKVVDGPGLEDTDLDAIEDKKQAYENMAKALMMCNEGIHAFVLVVKFGLRYTKEERTTISDLKQIFGDNYLKNHGIIVFTGGDIFSVVMDDYDTPGKTFEEWCREQDKDLGNLIKECSPRVVLFNNISKSEDKKTRQRNELLFHAGHLQKTKGLYRTEHFQAFAQVRSNFIKDSKQKILDETLHKRIYFLSVELERLSIDSSLGDIDTLYARITDVYTAIGEESLQEESMQQLIDCLKRLSTTAEEMRRAIWENNRTAKQRNLVVMSHHQEKLNKVREIPWVSLFAGKADFVAFWGSVAKAVCSVAMGFIKLSFGK